MVFPRPRIVVFRYLLSEQEMAGLRELAQPLVRKGGWGGVGQARWEGWGRAGDVIGKCKCSEADEVVARASYVCC